MASSSIGVGTPGPPGTVMRCSSMRTPAVSSAGVAGSEVAGSGVGAAAPPVSSNDAASAVTRAAGSR